MEYGQTIQGIFLRRPNRFIAHVLVGGKEEICHVRNTGRCGELLIPGARVVVCREQNPNRKTRFSLVAVYKGDLLVNIDSLAPNRAAREWLERGGWFLNPTSVRPETAFGGSRFDFLVTAAGKRHYVEVKGVTLERDGTALFPDAPTARGARHVRELCRCAAEGNGALLLFVAFCPNSGADPDFAAALREAADRGLAMAAFDCRVTEQSMVLDAPVPMMRVGLKRGRQP